MKKSFLLLFVGLLLLGSLSMLPAQSTAKTQPELIITTLAENNNARHNDLPKEFGFSALIERGNKRVVLDTGKAGEFLENAKKLKKDIGKVQTIVLTHSHYDHCGGLIPYYRQYGGKGKALFVKESFFDGANEKYFYDGIGRKFDFTDGTIGHFPVGINFTADTLKKMNVNVKYIKGDAQKILKGIYIQGDFAFTAEQAKAQSMWVKDKDEYIPDLFDEEIALVVETSKGLVIVSGCSHTGILNIVNTIQKRTGKAVYAVLGGFHMLASSESEIQSVIDRFKDLGVKRIGLSHCTGPKATKMFMEQLPNMAFINETGTVFTVE